MKDNQQPSSVFKQLKEDSDYLIYSDGRVYSKKSNKFLKGKIDNVGYQVYALTISDKTSISSKKLSKMCYAHRLVAEAFLPNPNNLSYVHHKDKNRLNNDISNLEWVTASENMQACKDKHSRRKPKYYAQNLPGERWMVIPFDINYSISSCGRVRNNRTNRLLHIDKNQKYERIQLSKKKHYYVHRLVYCVFNNDYDLNGYEIDHIDTNPENNKLENLQKITRSANCLKQKRFNDHSPGKQG